MEQLSSERFIFFPAFHSPYDEDDQSLITLMMVIWPVLHRTHDKDSLTFITVVMIYSLLSLLLVGSPI